MQIKLLPKDERPMEKACQRGLHSLSNSELIALIINSGTKDKSAIGLAEEILSNFQEGISEMAGCSFEDLVKIKGVGISKATRILSAIELGKRIASSQSYSRVRINSADDVANLFMERLRYEKREHFETLMVNSKGEIISIDAVSIGELSSTIVHPREVFSAAIRKSAAAVLFVHNHPSGDPSPSAEDVETTNRLAESGKLLGIKVLDHIIIGDGRFVSMRALGLVE